MARTRRGTEGTAGAEALPLHMTFRLSPGLRKQLADAAGGRPVGDEIRQRLEASFASSAPPAANDPRFAEIVRAVGYAAAITAQFYPDQGDIKGSAVFFEALERLVLAYKVDRADTLVKAGLDEDMRHDVTGVFVMALSKLDAPPEFIRRALAERRREAERDVEQGSEQ